MSKGSNFWGTARGKLGNMVISSVKGQQVERKYQPQVANPKTFSQMRQRANFASAVKFFKHSQQNLFKFAFEDKTQKESDYNAFMRHNVRCFTPVNKVACDNPTLPALGFTLALQLSFGSLPSPNNMGYFNVATNDGKFGFDVGGFIDPATADTFLWGEVSQAIIKNYGLSDGDILTFVVIRTGVTLGRFDEQIIGGQEASETNDPAVWTLEQRKLDTASTENVTDLVVGRQYFCTKEGITSATRDFLYFSTVIFSRNIKGRQLMVSTANLKCSIEDYESKLAYEDTAKERQALLSWGANPEAVLQGSLL